MVNGFCQGTIVVDVFQWFLYMWTIGVNGFSMVFYISTIGIDGFYHPTIAIEWMVSRLTIGINGSQKKARIVIQDTKQGQIIVRNTNI